jgi:signal transduction histidine kinase
VIRTGARVREKSMFVRLRWLSVLIPVTVVALIELLSDSLLDPVLPFPMDTILVTLAVLVAAVILSGLAFREIDRLTRELAAQNAQLAARSATARGLEEVAIDVAAGGTLQPTLARVASRARELLRAEVMVLEPSGADPPFAAIVLPAGSLEPSTTTRFGSASADAGPEADLIAAGFGSRLVTPLRLGGENVGYLAIAHRDARVYDVDEVETITALASLAVVAIRNDQVREHMRALAAQSERERIAREMHDGLAQVLAYVSTKAAAAAELLGASRTADAAAQMDDLGRVARSTYVDVREAILGLTTPIGDDGGIVRAISTYADRFAGVAKVVVTVESSDAARTAEIAAPVQAQAFRIVQEALTNVRKHAEAARVWIRIDVTGGDLRIAVRDDGRGLAAADASTTDWPRYGLTMMAARAREVGGSVHVTSASEGGTRVEIVLPVGSGRPRTDDSLAGAPDLANRPGADQALQAVATSRGS